MSDIRMGVKNLTYGGSSSKWGSKPNQFSLGPKIIRPKNLLQISTQLCELSWTQTDTHKHTNEQYWKHNLHHCQSWWCNHKAERIINH